MSITFCVRRANLTQKVICAGEILSEFSNTNIMVTFKKLSRDARKLSSGFPTRSDKNRAVQPHEMALHLKRRGIVLSMY